MGTGPEAKEGFDLCLTELNGAFLVEAGSRKGMEILVDQGEDRERFWDSCFSLDHSMIPGGYLRATPKQRFRQWLTHKLGAWESHVWGP